MAAAPPFSWSGLLQALFDVDESALGAKASPIASARTPRWSRSNSPSAASRTADDDDAALPYSPSRLDGEFNVWFPRKPLGLGLVPSTQLYGSWEVSSVAPATAGLSSLPASPSSHADAHKIRRGDVLIAVNFSTRAAQLPRDEFTAYLQQSACPVVVTLRRPALYGSFDSRSLSTAMFPASTEYRGKDSDLDTKRFLARAPSKQWKRSLQHELTQKKRRGKAKSRAKSAREPTPEADPLSAPTSTMSSRSDALLRVHEAETRSRNSSTADLTPMGEYSVTFHDVPLQFVLAPSTRLYGSVEVYDPKQHAPLIQIGDVVMAVNGDSSVARWPTDDVIDHISDLAAPVTITFRRPAAYRKYLETYFKTTHSKISSLSTATAMFPDSAEYKHAHYRNGKKSPAKPRRGSTSEKVQSTNSHRDLIQEGQGALTKQEWLRISQELNSSDQFKLWQSGSTKKSLSKSKPTKPNWSHTSAFLTERHVHYLWAHLPEYLTCNDMELVYDTRRHGWNLLSFYDHVLDKGPTILVVKDTRDQIFGAFSSTSWKRTAEVYGNGRCFVFSLRPQMKVYSWSGLDDTFMYGRRDAIMMGGGKKGIALCLQLDELRGFSHACDTFDSPPLAPSTNESGSFDMENMEVWCFSGMRV